MIKLKNIEAVGFTVPAVQELFNDSSRSFPPADAFKLSDAVQVIRTRLDSYFAEQKKIILACKGSIDSTTGRVTYPEPADQLAAQAKINELNEVELEYPIEKIKPGEGWPALTLTEASILRPLIQE